MGRGISKIRICGLVFTDASGRLQSPDSSFYVGMNLSYVIQTVDLMCCRSVNEDM